MDQFKRRDRRFPRDQHGRAYCCVVEKETGHPVGIPQPHVPTEKSWESIGDQAGAAYAEWCRENHLWPYAPVIPPQNHVHVHPQDSGAILVDYVAWEKETTEAESQWNQRLRDIAKVQYKDEALQMLRMDPLPRALLDLVGPKPVDVRVVRACAGGKSRWILGLPGLDGQPVARPAWADDLFPAPVVEEHYEDSFADAEWSDEDRYTGEPESLEGAVGALVGAVEQTQTMGDRMAHVRAQRRQKVA